MYIEQFDCKYLNEKVLGAFLVVFLVVFFICSCGYDHLNIDIYFAISSYHKLFIPLILLVYLV